jgi:hypothetical protein
MIGVGSEKQSMGKIMEHRRKYQERARGVVERDIQIQIELETKESTILIIYTLYEERVDKNDAKGRTMIYCWPKVVKTHFSLGWWGSNWVRLGPAKVFRQGNLIGKGK